MTESTASIEAFIAALPKVELHLHLVGSASVPTVLRLARRYPGSPVPSSEEELRTFYDFRDFAHFAEVYESVNGLVREPEDVAILVTGAARDLASQNVRYAELTVTPFAHQRMGMPMRAITEALDVAAREAREHGVRVGYIFDIPGEYGAEAARVTIDHALAEPPEALIGFGLAGIEQERPKYRDAFRDTFGAARAAGLHSVPHAGEMTGPESIWEAVEGLGAERIGHGIRCLDDPRLVAHLRETRIPLEVCPTSNVRTRQVPDIASHPLPRLLAEGLLVTINSDDPPMFGTTLEREYQVLSKVFGLGATELAALARDAVRASFLDDEGKREILAEIDGLAVLGSRTGDRGRPAGSRRGGPAQVGRELGGRGAVQQEQRAQPPARAGGGHLDRPRLLDGQAHRRSLLLARHDHPHLTRRPDGGQRHRDAGGRRLGGTVHRHHGTLVVHGGHPGEQGRHVAVGAEAEHENVEGRHRPVVLRSRGLAELAGVPVGGFLGDHALAGRGHGVDPGRVHVDVVEQRRAGAGLVALGITGRQEALVTPPDVQPRPFHRVVRGCGGHLGQRGDAHAAAGQHQMCPPLGRLGVGQTGDQARGHGLGQHVGVPVDQNRGNTHQ
jgi:adenosine deaminase